MPHRAQPEVPPGEQQGLPEHPQPEVRRAADREVPLHPSAGDEQRLPSHHRAPVPLRAAEGVPLRAAADLHHNGTSAMHDHPRDRVHRSAQFDFLDGLRASATATVLQVQHYRLLKRQRR